MMNEEHMSDEERALAMQRQKVFIHIGLPKTGSAFVQSLFATNRDYLEAKGLYYPRAGGHDKIFSDGGHHLLPIALMEARWSELRVPLSAEILNQTWPDLVEEIKHHPSKNSFISSEWFSFDIHAPESIRRIRAYLEGFDVYIILVLRDVIDLVNSVYSQRVRDGYDGSVAEYLVHVWSHLSWKALTKRWTDVFGDNNVLRLDYGEVKKNGIIETLTKIVIGSACNPADFGQEGVVDNRSLSVSATEMLLEVNRSAISVERKVEIRELIKDLYNKEIIKRSGEDGSRIGSRTSFVSADLEDLLRGMCKWPALTAI